MNKKIVLFIGGFKLPDGSASAQRALENGYLFESLGFKAVFIGKFANDESNNNYQKIERFDCFNINCPTREKKYEYYAKHIDSIKDVIDIYGSNKVHSIVAYNYPPIALRKLIDFCKKYNINVILDSTEWYGFEGGNLIRNIIRYIATQYRMRVLAKKSGNVICASRFLQRYYSNLNTTILPFSIDPSREKWNLVAHNVPNKPRQFIYAGSPGVGMSKDFIHLIIKALSQIKQRGYEFKFVVVGIEKDQFLLYFQDYKELLTNLGESVEFLGRQPHLKALELLKNSDYSILLRPVNRVSNAGFSTKIVESVSCGTPPITNLTSDISYYINDGVNGLIFKSTRIEDIEEKLITALDLPTAKLVEMSKNCHENNPFHLSHFQKAMKEFMKNSEKKQ